MMSKGFPEGRSANYRNFEMYKKNFLEARDIENKAMWMLSMEAMIKKMQPLSKTRSPFKRDSENELSSAIKDYMELVFTQREELLKAAFSKKLVVCQNYRCTVSDIMDDKKVLDINIEILDPPNNLEPNTDRISIDSSMIDDSNDVVIEPVPVPAMDNSLDNFLQVIQRNKQTVLEHSSILVTIYDEEHSIITIRSPNMSETGWYAKYEKLTPSLLSAELAWEFCRINTSQVNGVNAALLNNSDGLYWLMPIDGMKTSKSLLTLQKNKSLVHLNFRQKMELLNSVWEYFYNCITCGIFVGPLDIDGHDFWYRDLGTKYKFCSTGFGLHKVLALKSDYREGQKAGKPGSASKIVLRPGWCMEFTDFFLGMLSVDELRLPCDVFMFLDIASRILLNCQLSTSVQTVQTVTRAMRSMPRIAQHAKGEERSAFESILRCVLPWNITVEKIEAISRTIREFLDDAEQ